MTLNITLTAPAHVIQVSDRRMVSLPDGKAIDDDANKGLVLQTDDGIFAITFAGVGVYRRNRVDLWLAERMADEGVPELPIREGLKIISRLATEWFGTFPERFDKRHTFVIAGWQQSVPRPRPALWTISNCTSEDGRVRLDFSKPVFDVRELRVEGRRATVHAFGLHMALGRSDRRRLGATLRKSPELDRAEEAVVRMIRAAAAKPHWSWGINGEVLAIALAPNGEARSTYYPTGVAAYNYAPVFVWYEAGRNYVAGDAQALPTANGRYRIGRAMLVQTAGGAPASSTLLAGQEQNIKMLFRVSEGKHKHDPVGAVSFLQALG